jgi:RNA polymerase sigma-70 factor, ECF subfamily
VATTSAPYETPHPGGRLRLEAAAAARTEALYAGYARTVKGLCRALLRDRNEAEDAAQQTFLSAHRALLNGTDPREPAAWLATIARNECWSRIRSRMREPLASDELEPVSEQHDPLAEALRKADLRALWNAIEELPRQQRDALLLREFGGLSYEELAQALAVSGPAVESLLFRARQRLRVQLRAAYAAFSGASWLESLVRVFAGGGAPVAAKVAALGVGAAAVTGGAVVAPQVLAQHHRHATPPPARSVLHALEHHPRVAAPPAAPVVLAAAPQPVGTPATGRDEQGASGQSGRHENGNGDRGGSPRPRHAVAPARTSGSHESGSHDSGAQGSGRQGDGQGSGEQGHRPADAGSSGGDSGGGADGASQGDSPQISTPAATPPAPSGDGGGAQPSGD